MTGKSTSIIIRTFNEERYLPSLLRSIPEQADSETIIVDSGSTDNTKAVAKSFDCRIIDIEKNDFSFGRSLNYGCAAAQGDYLVFISGHCVPATEQWLSSLVLPLAEGRAVYCYGRQLGDDDSCFSEQQLFRRRYPEENEMRNFEFFCNNANAALSRSVWEKYRFDEELTGLEDMELAKRLIMDGFSVQYVFDAPVFHHHHESWKMVKRRYEREALALQHIMPEIHVSFSDFLRYFFGSTLSDFGAALQERCLTKNVGQIVLFRLMQYWGTYLGNHEHRKMSRARKEYYFYPK